VLFLHCYCLDVFCRRGSRSESNGGDLFVVVFL
jgi:hypothetical protein